MRPRRTRLQITVTRLCPRRCQWSQDCVFGHGDAEVVADIFQRLDLARLRREPELSELGAVPKHCGPDRREPAILRIQLLQIA